MRHNYADLLTSSNKIYGQGDAALRPQSVAAGDPLTRLRLCEPARIHSAVCALSASISPCGSACSMASRLAPMTPASAPGRDCPMCRFWVASGRHGPGVDGFPDACDEVLSGLGHGPPDRDNGGIDDADACVEDLANVSSGLPDGLYDGEVSRVGLIDHIGNCFNLLAACLQGCGNSGPAGDRLQATCIAAGAGDACASGDGDMADIACGAISAPLQLPPLIIPDPMPVATLTKIMCSVSGHIAERSPRAMMFTSLSTSTGTGKACWTLPGTSNPSQPRMSGGFDGFPVLCSTGPGRPIPTATRSTASR
jgi:hypothetical protein